MYDHLQGALSTLNSLKVWLGFHLGLEGADSRFPEGFSPPAAFWLQIQWRGPSQALHCHQLFLPLCAADTWASTFLGCTDACRCGFLWGPPLPSWRKLPESLSSHLFFSEGLTPDKACVCCFLSPGGSGASKCGLPGHGGLCPCCMHKDQCLQSFCVSAVAGTMRLELGPWPTHLGLAGVSSMIPHSLEHPAPLLGKLQGLPGNYPRNPMFCSYC